MEKTVMEFINPIPALCVTQGAQTFYVCSIKAKTLLEIAYTSTRTQYNRIGIQRGLRPDRLRDIGDFLKAAGGSPPLLPNAIIVSLSSDSYFEDGKLNIAKKQAAEAFVIDGQHRLWAFLPEYSGAFDVDLVVTAFIDLDDASKAAIFRSINGNQRKIDPSLVYDLIPMLRDKESVKFEDKRCQELVAYLNEDESSPWRDRIGMVGASERIISQSSFITSLKKLFKKGHVFKEEADFFEERFQREVLIEFFKALQSQYPSEWDNKRYLICKYVGVAALMSLFEAVVKDLKSLNTKISDEKNLLINASTFTQYFSKLKEFTFDSLKEKERGFTYVGESGVSELARKLNSIVFPA